MASRHALWLLLVPVGFNALTGPWLAMSGEDGDERIVGVLLTAFCVLALAVAWMHRRAPSRALWGALWTVPAAFGGTAAVMLAEGAGGLGGYYATIGVASALGLAFASGAPARAA